MGDLGEIVVVISGKGSNMRSLLAHARTYRVISVVSDNQDAPGIEYARERGIPTHCFPRSKYQSLSEQKKALFDQIDKLSPRFVALAGYMQIVPPEIARALSGKLVNIHPSLLPKFPGLHTHERALAAGEHEHGCSVHLVDEGIDTGAVIAQAVVQILPDDTADTLSSRVLQAEHQLYPWVLNGLCCGDITISDQTIQLSPNALATATNLNYRIPRGTPERL